MMSGQKKKKINKAEVIGKGLLTVLLIALELAIWPGYLVYNNYMSSSYSEYSVYSEPITERTEITQYFKPLYSRLDQIEFALGFEQEAVTDQVLHFVLYDEKNTELMLQDFPLGSMSADHFYALPLGVSLSRKQTYHWTLTIPEAAECNIRFMYAEHGNGVAPENIRLERNGGLFAAEDAQATTRYYYKIHPDKVIIIGGYWLGNALIYLILLETMNKAFKYWRNKKGTADETVA